MNKYGNIQTIIDGQAFDSRKEARRWQELKLMQRAGIITNLERQKTFVLIPPQKDPETGKIVERMCTYTADFVYKEKGKTVVEDVKSEATKTAVYKIKRKLMLERHGILIREYE